MSDEAQIYAPDYLRAQKDPQLHLIADMIEKQTESLTKQNRKLELTSLINGHMEAMRPLLDEWHTLHTGSQPGKEGK